MMLIGVMIAQGLGKLEPVSEAYRPAGDTPLGAANVVEKIISIGMGGITIVGSLYFILILLVSGVNWLSSGGDSGKIQKARDGIVHALIGMILLVSAYAIIGLIGSIVGLKLLNPGEMLLGLDPRKFGR